MNDKSFKFAWCETHQRDCDELIEDEDDVLPSPSYYVCPECHRENSEALYGAAYEKQFTPDIREVTNPSDKITIVYNDRDAARLAVLLVGEGRYGISGEDGLPIFLLGGGTAWIREQYNMTPGALLDSIPMERIAAALKSMKNDHERTSTNDIVGYAHKMAERMLEKKS